MGSNYFKNTLPNGKVDIYKRFSIIQDMVKNKNGHNPSEIGTLLEHIDDKVTLVAEQYTGLNKKIDKLVGKLDTVAEDVEVIKMDIEFIKHDLKNKVARDEFAVLERRVALLESRR